MSSSEQLIINQFFAAMQTGATAEIEMMSLFHDEAVYIEPFSGQVRLHTGKAAIRKCMLNSWKHPLPEMTIQIDEMLIEGNDVIVRWTCLSPALPRGKGSGENRFTLRDGLIIRLETRINLHAQGE